MTDIEELLESLYKENKITYEEYSAIIAVLRHKTLVIESYIQSDVEAEEIIAELKAQIEEMRKCLDKWYSQYSDNGYTEYFYKCLLEQTKNFLFTDVSTK